MDVVIHFDEIFLKGKNQGLFIKKLADNIRRLFKGAKVTRIEGGLFVTGLADDDLYRLALIPGVAKFAPAIMCRPELTEIKSAVLGIVHASDANSFRILASRADKNFKITSDQVNIQLGQIVVEKTGWKVNLKKPDLTIHVDIAKNRTIVCGNLLDGAGGLPTGTAGKILCLLSGGLDSPVAAYEIMKRGAEIVLVHFQNQTQVVDEVSQKIIDLAKILARYQDKVKLIIVPFSFYQKQVVMNIPADCRMIVTRRLMFKLSEIIAKQEKALALVTGDSLGQVASQTLENLTVVYQATAWLKLTPLIAQNKTEIVKIAKKIGTFDISIRPYEDCCSLFVAKHPKTKAQAAAIEKLEEGIDYSGLDKITPISYHIGID